MLLLQKATLISFVSPIERRFGVPEKQAMRHKPQSHDCLQGADENQNTSVDVRSRASIVLFARRIGGMPKFELCSERSDESH
jgi:hypothetical protein